MKPPLASLRIGQSLDEAELAHVEVIIDGEVVAQLGAVRKAIATVTPEKIPVIHLEMDGRLVDVRTV